MSKVPVRIVAPVLAMGATFLARKALSRLYVSRTGHEPPAADDREVSVVRAIGWAAATAVVSAVIEVAITRIAAMQEDDVPTTDVGP